MVRTPARPTGMASSGEGERVRNQLEYLDRSIVYMFKLLTVAPVGI